MVELSRSKISQHIQEGRAEVVVGDVHNLSFIESNSVDRVGRAHVPTHLRSGYLSWSDLPHELLLLLARPGGRVEGAAQSPQTGYVNLVRKRLEASGKMLSAMKYNLIKKANHDPAIFRRNLQEGHAADLSDFIAGI
eukprot:750866-Hanusia_phi.AAC.3